MGESYFHLLENFLMPSQGDVSLGTWRGMWFQQHGAPPHFMKNVSSFLDTFKEMDLM